ncbi:MAG: amidohydrolase family protein [Daejeonella sp.]|uniref:amidohydrolase family protein n=1 Tax=Daejeonella sp. TaxID=2805397 RepID=UPI0027341E02|nr:amidohydrolase family protein [Daejeonella sp.]MDP3468686.1 amidohydrolase family protein [Daejeonella sp.]
MLKLDSHQHFWKFNSIRDNWITEEMEVIRHDFLPPDLKPLLYANGIEGCIAVQADQSESETDFLLAQAKEHNFIKGVVGWVDLCSPNIHERLEHYSQFSTLKGFRHILQSEPVEFILKPEFQRGISALHVFGFTYDILIYPQHLPVIPDLLRSHGNQAFIIDHLAKPDIKNGLLGNWETEMKHIASFENVYCKLSGMVTEADLRNWKKEDIFPYMDKVFDFFGAERLMFGSDWPVCKLAGEYDEVCGLLEEYLSKLSIREQELVWAKNAEQFYKL